jgi:hypothetical protein
VLWLMLKPDTMMGLADANGNPNWLRPGSSSNARNATRWRSITQTLSTTGVDLSRVEYLEFWVWEDNRRTARAHRTAALFDFGAVFEDGLAFIPDSFTVSPTGDTTYYGVRIAGVGRLDTERDPITLSWNAATDDEGILTDRVVDGIRNATTGELIATLPLCSATVRGQLQNYTFGDPRSRCGRRNGALDSEDQDGDAKLDVTVGVRSQEDFVRFVFPIGDEQYFVRDGGMVDAPASQGGGASGWRLYRIPFRTDTLQQGSPNLRQVQALRLTVLAPETAAFGEPDLQVYFALSRVRLVGSTWLKRAETPVVGLGGDRGTGLGKSMPRWSAPRTATWATRRHRGVRPGRTGRRGFQVGSTQINEQSLRLLARGLTRGQRAEAFTRFGTEGDKNFLKYRQLRVWARGRGPGWEDGDLEFFFKVGKDPDNFYLYHAPVRTSSWEPEVVITLDRWVALRARIEQAWLSGAAPHVGAGCPDSTIAPFDSAFVMCDGPYIAHVKDPGIAPPNLAAVQEIAAGILRVRAATFIDQAELWVDESGCTTSCRTWVLRRRWTWRSPSQTGRGHGGPVASRRRFSPAGWTELRDQRRPERQRHGPYGTVPAARLGTRRAAHGAPCGGRHRSPVPQRDRHPRQRARRVAHPGLPPGATPSLRRARRASRGSRAGLWTHSSSPRPTPPARDAPASARRRRGAGLSLDYGLTPRRPCPPRRGSWCSSSGSCRHSSGGAASRPARAGTAADHSTAIRLRSSLAGGSADRTSFRLPVIDTGDVHLVPARSTSRVWRNSASLDLLPLTGVQLRADLASQRDLRDYGDSSSIARIAQAARKSLLGVDVGFESQRTFGTFFGLTPQLAPWLRPRSSLATSFSLTRTPMAARPSGSWGPGAFRLPPRSATASGSTSGRRWIWVAWAAVYSATRRASPAGSAG